MDMFIRKMESHDYLPSLKIAKAFPEWFTAKGLEMLENDLRSQMGLVAFDGNKVNGFCIYSIDRKEAIIS